MTTAPLINDDLEPPLSGFVKAPTPTRKSKTSRKPVPFTVRWLNQIASDGTLQRMAYRTAIRLADYYDEQKGYAWPSQIRLATDLKASRSGVRQGIEQLENAGYLEYVPERGRKRTNRYFLRCPEPENGH